MSNFLTQEWRKYRKLSNILFTCSELNIIDKKKASLKINHLVLCSLENRFAKSGGLASVITNILPYLKEVNNIPSVLLFTPYYPKIINRSKLKSSGINFSVPYLNKIFHIELLEYDLKYTNPCKGRLKEYYLKSDCFFSTSGQLSDPYTYDESDVQKNNNAICLNSLFFCKAVPLALKAIGISKDIIFHLHEWQTVLISLTSKEAMLNGSLESCGSVQTMHNSYDSIVSRKLLGHLIDRSRRQRISCIPEEGYSAYQIGLQLVDAPVTTVSKHFSTELTSDIIQTKYYAPHLQSILNANKIIGVNNGAFVDFSREFPKREKHSVSDIRRIKLRNRHKLLEMLDSFKPRERFGDLTYRGSSITKLPDEIPIIVMSGRLDPLQKGYGVLLRVIENYSEDEIKVILTPLPIRKSDLDYFYEVACKCRGNVTVFPFRMKKGYEEIQTGSTYGIMPSIYEPFGAAVEYMANGTVNIGRATGGLVDQIDSKCGFLYRENPIYRSLENVKAFVESNEYPQMRKTNPWIQNMAVKLYETLNKAIYIYKSQPDTYYQLIINGFKKAHQFSWEDTAKRYYKIYKMIYTQ